MSAPRIAILVALDAALAAVSREVAAIEDPDVMGASPIRWTTERLTGLVLRELRMPLNSLVIRPAKAARRSPPNPEHHLTGIGTTGDIMDFLRHCPGSTLKEIQAGLPLANPESVKALLSRLKRDGRVESRRVDRRVRNWIAAIRCEALS